MEETEHCRCWKCGGYIPPGGTYAHLSNAHSDDPWNEHMAAWSDKRGLEDAQPWVRGEGEKAEKGSDTPPKAPDESKEQAKGKGGEQEDVKAWAESLFEEHPLGGISLNEDARKE